MKSMAMGWTPRERALLVLCIVSLGISIAGYLDLGGNAGAAPRGGGGVGSSITSDEIRNGTIRSADIGPTIKSADIRDGTIQARDLGLYHATVLGGTSVPGGAGTASNFQADVSCEPGDKPLSGGYSNGNPGSIVVDLSYPEFPPGNRWLFSLERIGQTSGFVYTFALCLNN